MSATLGIAVSAFLFNPHGRRQDQIRRKRGNGRIGVGHHDEVVGIPVARIGLTELFGAAWRLLLTWIQ